MFSKILIANRGEVAVRIIRSCKEMGIATVAVHSRADADALHVALADESYCIGENSPADSYLNMERIISAALISGAQAIHPGYGFLSENAEFSSLCLKNDIAFIGPSAEQMIAFSDKEKLKAQMLDAGLKVIPGSGLLESLEDAQAAAEKIGYPVMLKARLGGGGRGIRFVRNARDIEQVFFAAKAESQAAFGDDALYMEKFIHPARHVEMQIIADEKGSVICLGERDCSIQKNHQKLVEEAPSPALSEAKRTQLIEEVRTAISKLGYQSLGTLEFLMDAQGNCYFMEMNVRLQVEHGVTEALTGIDLVKWQIRVAAGVELPFKQEDIPLQGSSIECRINAQSPGTITALHVPGGPFVRFDTFLTQGAVISPSYDPLVGKLIVFAATREEALRKMHAALCELVIDGINTNIDEQLAIISDARFASGSYNLDFFTS